MSKSSLWGMNKEYKGFEIEEFGNSFLFSPVVWDILLEKYLPNERKTSYGYTKSIIGDRILTMMLNDKINFCDCVYDRICWELSNQQIFFTKDKNIVAKNILDFINFNYKYSKDSDGEFLLGFEHIIERFSDMAESIKDLDINENLFFIFKNTSVDDNVECWFQKYDNEECNYIKSSLIELNEIVIEFVFIKNGMIDTFKNNIEYFKQLNLK